ncbi:MAG: glycosyltransferase family 4 protein [Chthonomonas sp.]|nr:glycosyltransferase family 4 protein [Chthonomonas sp.]
MRLAILSSLDSPWSYGAIEAIAKAGAEVHAFQVAGKGYIDPNSPDWLDRIASFERHVATRTVIRGGPFKYVQMGSWLRNHFKTLRPDAVLSLYAGGLGLAAIRSKAPRTVLYAVGSDVLATRPPKAWATRRNLSMADLVVANGQYLAEQTKKLAPHAKVRELLLGVDTSVFVPSSKPPVPTMICTRGFSSVYNNLTILKALALLPDDLPEWRFQFVAGGPLVESHQEWAKANLSSTSLARVDFIGGLASQGVLRALQESSIFVSMSRSDGTATSLLEAMSCGLYPVLSDIPANRPWAKTLISPDDPVALAKALEEAIRHPGVQHPSGQEARERIVLEADSTNNMAELVKWIRDLPAKPHA